MKRFWVLFIAPLVITIVTVRGAQMPGDRSVVALDPALNSLISPDAKLELVKSGFGFTEGINWVQKGKSGYLLFSDIPANVVDKMTSDGQLSVYVDQSGYRGPWNGYMMLTVGGFQNNGKDRKDPLFKEFVLIGSNGLTLDPQGRLVICAFAARSVDRIEKNGKRVVLADHYEGSDSAVPTT